MTKQLPSHRWLRNSLIEALEMCTASNSALNRGWDNLSNTINEELLLKLEEAAAAVRMIQENTASGDIEKNAITQLLETETDGKYKQRRPLSAV